MTNGDFEALGNEQPRLDSVTFLSGPIAFGLLGLLVATLLIYPKFYSLPTGSWPGDVGWTIIVLTLLGISGWWFADINSRSRPRLYNVHYTDETASGKLELKYGESSKMNSGQNQPKLLLVRTIKLFPNQPLLKQDPAPKSVGNIHVSGTVCSLRVDLLKSQYSLWLGFPSLDEMNRIYSQLTNYSK